MKKVRDLILYFLILINILLFIKLVFFTDDIYVYTYEEYREIMQDTKEGGIRVEG